MGGEFGLCVREKLVRRVRGRGGVKGFVSEVSFALQVGDVAVDVRDRGKNQYQFRNRSMIQERELINSF